MEQSNLNYAAVGNSLPSSLRDRQSAFGAACLAACIVELEADGLNEDHKWEVVGDDDESGDSPADDDSKQKPR